MSTNMTITIESSFPKYDPCLLEHAFSTISDRALDEGLKRSLEKSCCIESPANKKKESWTFREPAMIVWPPLSTISSSRRMAISCLPLTEDLTEDNRRAKIANMLQEATDMAQAVGELDPEPESRPNGRRRFQRRNSFVIHRNRKSTGTLTSPALSTTKTPGPSTTMRTAPSITKITYSLNEMCNEANGALGPLPSRKSNLFC
jgi:hypothetical protein